MREIECIPKPTSSRRLLACCTARGSPRNKARTAVGEFVASAVTVAVDWSCKSTKLPRQVPKLSRRPHEQIPIDARVVAGRWRDRDAGERRRKQAEHEDERLSEAGGRKEARGQGPPGFRQHVPEGEAGEGAEQDGRVQREDEGHEQGRGEQGTRRVHEGELARRPNPIPVGRSPVHPPETTRPHLMVRFFLMRSGSEEAMSRAPSP